MTPPAEVTVTAVIRWEWLGEWIECDEPTVRIVVELPTLGAIEVVAP